MMNYPAKLTTTDAYWILQGNGNIGCWIMF